MNVFELWQDAKCSSSAVKETLEALASSQAVSLLAITCRHATKCSQDIPDDLKSV